MPYMEAWDDFFAAAQRIQQAAPMRTRLWHKYRHDDGVLTIKVTDDRECIKFRTELSSDLKNLEILTSWFLTASSGIEDDRHGGGGGAGHAGGSGGAGGHGTGHGHGRGAGTHGSRARAAKRSSGAARRRKRREAGLSKATGTG